MCQTSKKKRLGTWIEEYILNIDKNTLKEAQKNWTKQFHSSTRGLLCLEAIIPNEATIVSSLTSILETQWDKKRYNSYKREYECQCELQRPFNKALSDKLWQIARENEYHFKNKDLNNHLISIGKEIISHANEGVFYIMDSEQRAFVRSIMAVMKLVSIENTMLFAQADVASVIMFGWRWEDVLAQYKSFIEHYCYNEERKVAFLEWMIEYNDLYMKTVVAHAKQNQDWKNLFHFVLKQLSQSHEKQPIVKAIDKFGNKFFQTLGNSHTDWLLDVMSQNSGSKDQRTVAVAIVNYVVCAVSKPKDVVTKKLVQFVNDVLDLQWKLPQT